jgi:hypothetical protein
MAATEYSTLDLVEIGIPPHSTDEIEVEFGPIPQATYQRRDLNGRKHNLAASSLKLYRLGLSGRSVAPPAFAGLWPGDILTVHVPRELCRETTSDGFDRAAVPGSEYSEDGFSFYRPLLTMMVEEWSESLVERTVEEGWELVLEELEMPAESSA